MPEDYKIYQSDLTGPELDEALRNVALVNQRVQDAQEAATQAASSATSAQSAASQASSSASTASTAASTATSKAEDAATAASEAATSETNAAESARQAAASAASIEGSVSAAESAAQDASDAKTAAETAKTDAQTAANQAQGYLETVQTNAQAAQEAAEAAESSKTAAATSASQAATSATTASDAAQAIEENLAAIEAAPGAAQAAQAAQAAAEAAQAAAEDAAERAQQIADFDPADFATAAQGAKADTAVQAVNGKSGTEITLTPADIGAATAEQGAKADTAVQPAALEDYAKASDIPTELPSPEALGIRLGSGGELVSYDGSTAKMVTVTPEAIGAATTAQGAKADTAVQSINGQTPDVSGNIQLETGGVKTVNSKTPDGSGNVQLTAADVGAATEEDIPTALPNPNSLLLKIGTGSSYYNGQNPVTATITPDTVGAAQEPLVGTMTSLTGSEIIAAVQAGRQVFVTNGDDVFANWQMISSAEATAYIVYVWNNTGQKTFYCATARKGQAPFIETKIVFPSFTSSYSGRVLTVRSDGTLGWDEPDSSSSVLSGKTPTVTVSGYSTYQFAMSAGVPAGATIVATFAAENLTIYPGLPVSVRDLGNGNYTFRVLNSTGDDVQGHVNWIAVP